MRKKVFVDLFCGAGGLGLGLERAGFRCVGAIDIMPAAIETHKLNFPNCVAICSDIRDMSPKEFARRVGVDKVDVLVGGPPCPTFSTIGHAKIRSVRQDGSVAQDPRNTLFLEYFRYVKAFSPDIWVMENVPQFITKYKGSTFNEVMRLIEDELSDYDVVEPVRVLNAVNYGVPQNRRRMFMVGVKKGLHFSYPSITHWHEGGRWNHDPRGDRDGGEGLKANTTVRDALGDLPAITDNWRESEMAYDKDATSGYQRMMRAGNGKTVWNNICRMSNDRAKRVFAHMEQGDRYMDLPREVRAILPFREDIFKDRLKRLVLDDPSWTVLAHIGMDGYMYIHPTELRTLSVREAARIMSFPDSFTFVGNQQDTYVQVGNAVPPLLAEALGNSCWKALH